MLGREGNGTPLQYSCLENPMNGGAWWVVVHGVAKSWTRLSDFTFTFHSHALEKEMETHSSVLAWRIPGTGEPGGLPSMGLHRVEHDWSEAAAADVRNPFKIWSLDRYSRLRIPCVLNNNLETFWGASALGNSKKLNGDLSSTGFPMKKKHSSPTRILVAQDLNVDVCTQSLQPSLTECP